MSKAPHNKFKTFVGENLLRVLALETESTLGDRSKYIGASDIGGCPYKVVKSKLNPPVYSLEQQIIFQRGHLAEDLVSKMLEGLNVVDQHEALGEIDEFALKAHIDKIITSKKRCVIIEVKTVSAPVDEPYESWVLQVQYQMGLMLEECDHDMEAYVLAMDLNTGWLEAFPIEFDDGLFELCLSKASHLISALKGECEPKAIIQNYCGSCHLKMECPKQGRHADELPDDIKADLEFVKKSKEMAKESKSREARVKEYLVNMGIEIAKDSSAETVVSVKEQETNRLDIERFKADHPDLYEEYLKSTSSFKMTVL